MRYLDRPIRVFGRLALGSVGLATLIMAVLGYLNLAYGVPVVRDRSGWFILSLVLYVSGIQFLLFGLVSEVVVTGDTLDVKLFSDRGAQLARESLYEDG